MPHHSKTADRVLLAARNNALWCDTVCRTHGLRGSMDDLAWTSPRRTPPYYPDAVTLSPDVEAHDLLARIDSSDGCSVKDSWSSLDLTMEDFARLVVGDWLWLDQDADPGVDGRHWWRVTTAAQMASWSAAWAVDDDDAAVLGSALLAEAGVHVLAASPEPGGRGSEVVAGGIVNVTGEVAGLGNLFDRDGDVERVWRGAATAAREVVGGIPLVGWEAGAGRAAAVAAGCERLGPLTVWIR